LPYKGASPVACLSRIPSQSGPSPQVIGAQSPEAPYNAAAAVLRNSVLLPDAFGPVKKAI